MPTVDRDRVTAALPGYTVGRELGAGAFGLVLAGHHHDLDRDVAIKILSMVADDDTPGTVAHFTAQARVLSRLDHPHIVGIYDYVGQDDLCLLIMELLAGGTLTGQHLSAEGACALGLAVADALTCAHTAGVLHRDIKPGNILFTTTGQPKITDFGIAKILDSPAETASRIVGTPKYMAPEQITGDRLGPATDLYALGAILYELLAGTPPFDPRLPLPELFRHHCQVPPPPPAGVPAPLAGVVMRTLAKHPTDRYPSAHAFTLDLTHAATRAYGPHWTTRCGITLHDSTLDGTTHHRADELRGTDELRNPATHQAAHGDTTYQGAERGTITLAPVPGQPTPLSPSPAVPPSPAGEGTTSLRTPTPARRQPVASPPAARSAPLPAGGDATVHLDHAAMPPTPPTTASPLAAPPPASPPPPGAPSPPPPPAPPRPAGAGNHRRMRRRWVPAVLLAAVVLAAGSGAFLVVPGWLSELSEPGAQPPPPPTEEPLPSSSPPQPPPPSPPPPAFPAMTIATIAGTGQQGFSGDGGPAAQASLSNPYGPAVDAAGNLYIPDFGNHRIRRVDARGIITTVAGTGTRGFSGDGGPATQASLNSPASVAVDAAGNLYIADTFNHRVRRVDTRGIITTVAGTAERGRLTAPGNGGPAGEALLWYPSGVAVDAAGNFYIADSANNRVCRVDTRGMLTTMAGLVAEGHVGDGGPAAEALLDNPFSIAADAAGNVYIADHDNHRVRRIDAAGIITTIAGTGTAGYTGDGGPATQAALTAPRGVAVDAAGNVYVTDQRNSRVRRIDAAGIITTIAGTGTAGYSGDGGPATRAALASPDGAVAVTAAGDIYIADRGNNRIRTSSPGG